MKTYTLKNYIEYLKDNPKGYWFKRRLYGWGWVPAKKEGWFTIAIFLIILFGNVILLSNNENPTQSQLTIFFSILILSIIALIFICYKNGEKPKWTWGKITVK